jgi:hypothetical protein
MTTVSSEVRWFDESAEALLGLPVAEAILDVMSAGLRVEVWRPEVHRVRDGVQACVALVTNRRGVVTDVVRLHGPHPIAAGTARPRPDRTLEGSS